MPAKRSDKEVIHLDYITTDKSLRVLAKDHNVAVSTLKKWKDAGHWDVERKALLAEATQQAIERFDTDKEQALDSLSDRAEKILLCIDKLLVKTEQLLNIPDALAPRDVKSLSSVLVDVITMQNSLKGEEEEEGNAVTVTLAGPMDDWAG